MTPPPSARKAPQDSFYEAVEYVQWAVPPFEFSMASMPCGGFLPARPIRRFDAGERV